MIAIPDTRRLLHAYGLAVDTPMHLAALVGGDDKARSAALYHLQSAIMHQSTPWPVTGLVAQYLAALIVEGVLSDANARSVVLDVLAEVQAAAALALRSSDRMALEQSAHPSGIDVDKEIAGYAERDALDELYEDDVLAGAIMARAFLSCVDALPAIERCLSRHG